MVQKKAGKHAIVHTFVSYEMKQEYSLQFFLLECHFLRYYCSHQQKKIFKFKIIILKNVIDQPLIKTTVDEFILSMFLLQSHKNLPVNRIILLIAQVYYIVWTTEREK